MSNQFADPAEMTGIKWDDLEGALLLIKPYGLEQGVVTNFGTTDAVRADVTVLDGSNKGEEYPDALVFPRVLQGQLKPRTGQLVVGRLGKGAAKPGQSAPWKLDKASKADIEVAEKHLANKPSSVGEEPPF
ncbi:hypothetical protein ACFV9C_25230 [Kribbella sp. NPDC059898]|uniref:hypothetical protein n=1 Tax=Kribbella sp. NPDC059898 TaxID=3346995 RepID=UPI0036629D77